MTTSTNEGLSELRRRLGYRFESVVRLAKISASRLQQLEEKADAPSVYEADQLARLYGIETDRLLEENVRLSPVDAIVVLASQDEFRDVSDVVRARIVASANASRDLIRLRKLENAEDPRWAFGREAPRPVQLERGLASYRQGARQAAAARKHFRLGKEPIPSLRNLVADRLPSINVLYASLTADGPAGISFADAWRGPTIVLNLDGKNANPCVRRFSLAHELCHLFTDWQRGQSLGVLSGYLNDSSLEMERRANAFAVRFLCPESVIKSLPDLVGSDAVAAAEQLRKYGLSYAALRLYLHNETSLAKLPPLPPPQLAGIGTEPEWVTAEDPVGMAGFPLEETPPERRTAVALAAARAYSTGKITRDEFAELLGVTPLHDVERVLDFFALNLPSDASHAA